RCMRLKAFTLSLGGVVTDGCLDHPDLRGLRHLVLKANLCD
ncbi:hypothetical protein JCM3770_003358, partial [Rhodotorula araucariae]